MRPCRCFALPPNKNRLTHDRPRKGQKATINHALKQKRGLMNG
nr:MAG TPA: hypothetical protein [Caudoviricetes sp.]